ncbi:hypothetical protein M9Y10_030068 [Tritrichomonas musculus]|uniref:Fungal lipase-type domain-containing protein n=1 Tax=Tritrichomonas musculus TaxID=1915356 RepID=A0ABR2KS87_9EUKA
MNDNVFDIDSQSNNSSEIAPNEGSAWDHLFSPFYKLIFKYPAKITKLLLQFGEFYFFIELLCLTLQFFVILITSTARLETWKIIFLFLFFSFFSFLFGNTLTISLWEFVQIRWLNSSNPTQTIFDIFKIEYRVKNFKIFYIILSVILGIFFWIYIALGFIGSNAFDVLNSIILFFIPCLKTGAIYFCYLIRAIQAFFFPSKLFADIKDPFVISMKNPKFEFFSQLILKILVNKHERMFDTNKNIMKILKKYGEMKIEFKRYFFMLIKEIGSIFGLIYLIYLQANKDIKMKNMLLPYVIWFYNTILSFAIEMPIWSINVFDRWDTRLKVIEASGGINGQIRRQHYFKGFKYVNTFCTFIIPFLIFAYFVFLQSQSTMSFEQIDEQTLWNGELSHNYDNLPFSEKQVRSPMCGIGIYHLNLVQIASIAAASYYNNTELTLKYYKNSFFRDDDLILSKLYHVLDKDNEAVLLRADIDILDSSRNLTIFSVRGSTTSIDWWLDFEIFISAALTSVARWFPILQSYETFGSKVISGFMTFPLYSMSKATLTYSYTEKMFNIIQEFINDESNVNRSILFTGHSLGGGLSKVLANKFGRQAVSFSGPGISPIEDKFKKEKYDKYFKAKFIDIVPDNDFVPRFEVSSGTNYRVLCEQNGAECHSILRTICQLGVSCGLEYYTGDFCRGRYNKYEYDSMISLSTGHKRI